MNTSEAWINLEKHHSIMVKTKIDELFLGNSKRFSEFSLQFGEILFDYSKQPVTKTTLESLFALAETANLSEKIVGLFAGDKINISENRAVLHMSLRDPDAPPQILAALEQMSQWVDSVHHKTCVGMRGQAFTDVISLGIGGSDLGPLMVCEALAHHRKTNVQLHFISNVDGKTLQSVLSRLDPASTLCIINSKSFTTPETLRNAKTVKSWFEKQLGMEGLAHLYAVSAEPKHAENFGVLAKNIFKFWDFVGGRYSIWSSVGLPIALQIGMDGFKEFLAGAHEMDQHFRTAEFSQNMPIIMALLGVWNINFWNRITHAIIPYDDGLRQLPSYLQQLEMESNGKRVKHDESPVNYATAPIIWGGVGCNGQHAYMQLLHQGTEIVPVDFLVAIEAEPGFEAQHQLLVASCLSQGKSLMEGSLYSAPQLDKNLSGVSGAKYCPGNRPSSTLMYPKLTPRVLGSLIALYEHKVFVQGVIWGINSFDQWGVELGKEWVKKIEPFLELQEKGVILDSSTQGLIDYYKKIKNRRG